MGRSNHILKNSLFFLLLLLLFMPLIQSTLNLIKVKELKGSFTTSQDQAFKREHWFSGLFQETKGKYLNENFGFRNSFIRVNNQLKFALFKKNSNIETVVGKENYLFAEAYIESYTGKNFAGVKKIVEKCWIIKQLQLKMLAQGKILLPVLAPNKARALDEFLPEGVTVKGLSNYECMVFCFKKFKIDYLDFNDYFLKNYSSSAYPLFPRHGVHWSSYGHTLAADSIVKYLNTSYHLKTPTLVWKDRIIQSDVMREMDYDAGDAMNLFFNLHPIQKMAYPQCEYADLTNPKPPLLVVGDSYNFGLEFTGAQNHIFSEYKFLYYFNDVMPHTEDPDAFLKLDLKKEIENHQVFLMVATEHNLKNFGWAFPERALAILNGKNVGIMDSIPLEIKLLESQIRRDPNWCADLREKVFVSGEDFDSVLVYIARTIVDQKHRRKEASTPLMEIVQQMRGDPKWMSDVIYKATRKKIPVDSAIMIDARWLLQQKASNN